MYPAAEEAARYFRSGAWIDRRIDQQLRHAKDRYGDRPAFICDGTTISFASLDDRSEALATRLQALGLRQGDRALFQMGTTIETVISFFACLKAGLVPVCTIPQYRELEMHKLADLTQPKAYFVQAGESSFDLPGFARGIASSKSIPHLIAFASTGSADPEIVSLQTSPSSVRPGAELTASSEDVAVIQLSGGSTGVPKLIPRFHAEYLGHVRVWCERFGVREGDVGIWALPLMHNAGMMFALLRSVIFGSCTVLMPRWNPREFLTLIERCRVSHAFTIGPHAPAIASFEGLANFDLSSLRFFLTLQGAAPIERATGVPTTNMFGITEGLVLTSGPGDPEAIRHGSVGSPCSPFDSIRLLRPGTEEEVAEGELGELCFKGPSSLRGYLGAPELSAECLTSDGFFRTADLMRRGRFDGRA
ncbi:AMP-binding protein, partial [Bradyrhizobium nitroreducens]|uniref:AMP-binding protein n=1 Tax=Bradyrhizobium nitroreducens TaxID=709803 RepID=UPI001AEF6FB9